MQSINYDDELSLLSLKELQVLLQSGLVEIEQIEEREIGSQQQLLIYFHQLERKVPKEKGDIKKCMHALCTRLLNDQFKSKLAVKEKQGKGSSDDMIGQKSQQKDQDDNMDHEQVYNDESRLLAGQIYNKIHAYFPQATELIDPAGVHQFNKWHSCDILDLVAIELQIPDNFTQPQQIVSIVKNIVLPIICSHPDFCQKGVQIISSTINYFSSNPTKKSHLINSLSQMVTSLCLSFASTPNQLSIHQIISIVTVIEAVQSSSQTYHPSLANSKLFHSFIYRMLLCSNVDSKTANSVAVNVYGALLKQLGLYCSQAQIFINLYSTLRCFGAHLVKDIWPMFYDFIELQGKQLIFTKAQLIDIIFYKIQHHENANVVKHCIQSILQQKRSFILFNKVPDAIFNSLMRILNYGMHYLDCLFHMDSKMFPMISNFFSGFFNSWEMCKQTEFENQVRLFLNAICQKITFDHALVAMLHSFTLIARQSCAVGKEEIVWISALVRKYYGKYPIRKKHQMMNGVCCLLKNHLKSVKKTTAKSEQKSQNQVDLYFMMKNCLIYFPDEYVMLNFHGQEKRSQIYQIIEQNFSKEEISQTLNSYAQSMKEILNKQTITSQSFQSLVQTLRLVQFIIYLSEQKQGEQNSQKLSAKFKCFQVETFDSLRQVYTMLCDRFVTDLGQSLYKSMDQRIFGIHIQKACLEKIFCIKVLIPKFDICNFIEKVLSNVSLLVKDCIESDSKHILAKEELAICQYLVNKVFQMIYEFSREEGKQELEEKAYRSGSQFLQWATDHIHHAECHMLILTALKTRIHESSISPISYIEQSVYRLFWWLFAVENKGPSVRNQVQGDGQDVTFEQKVRQISPLYRLRLLTVCGSILFYDDNQVRKFYNYFAGNIEQLADRYDFENLDEILYFVELVYTCQQSAIDKKAMVQFVSDSQQTYVRISKVISSILETMLTSLNYGVDSKEVIACGSCVLNIMFDFAAKFGYFSPELASLSIKVIKIGEQYWMFERMMAFKTVQNLSIMLEGERRVSYTGLFPLLTKILMIEEYRGYDSAVALEKELSKEQFYAQLKLILHGESDYEGMACRLGVVEFVNSLVESSLCDSECQTSSNSLNQFLEQLFVHMLTECKKDTPDKMFLTGEHKNKLKLWQCLLAYTPEWVIRACSTQSNRLKFTLEQLIVDIIQIIDKNNNLFQVKYYIELFLMKLLINDHSLNIVSVHILNLLSQKLLELTSQANKNVSFIFISGAVMNFMFRNCHIAKHHPLYQSLQKLYTSTLIYSCSHVAYFRGLSQYFCLERLFVESQYTRILHQVIGKDADTILLKNKLDVIVNEYYSQIKHWTIRANLFNQLPTLSGNIVSETFYMERLKRLGQELLRQIKAEIGFHPYKQIWVQAVQSLNLTNNLQIDVAKQPTNANSQQQAIFQRKIDPSLDFIYFSKTKMQGFEMKILITGSKSIPIYGHLSRTGQIFGLSQLIIPYKQIVEDEEFKNVACTAEKWLNISWFSSKQQANHKQKYQLALQRQLLTKRSQGYTFFMLQKHPNSTQQTLQSLIHKIHNTSKILLILDSQNYLPPTIESLLEGKISFGLYFSEHVEASIFIWEYFRKVYGRKFRSEVQVQVC